MSDTGKFCSQMVQKMPKKSSDWRNCWKALKLHSPNAKSSGATFTVVYCLSPDWTMDIRTSDAPNQHSAAARLSRHSQCVADVAEWLSASCLHLNPAKSLLIWLGSRQQVQVIDDTARDLGVIVDSLQLTMRVSTRQRCVSVGVRVRQFPAPTCQTSVVVRNREDS